MPFWLDSGGDGGVGSAAVSDTYTGDGVADRTISLPSAVDWVAVYGSPTDHGQIAFAYASDSSGGGLRINESFVSNDGQVLLSSDGLTMTVDGTGTGGMNESGTVYHYVGV